MPIHHVEHPKSVVNAINQLAQSKIICTEAKPTRQPNNTHIYNFISNNSLSRITPSNQRLLPTKNRLKTLTTLHLQIKKISNNEDYIEKMNECTEKNKQHNLE